MKPIYLEPDEEITSVIDKLSQVEDKSLAIVVPKNSTLLQSLVNLKLLQRQAQKLGKSVAIISGNKIGSRLADQIGIQTYATLGAVSSSSSAKGDLPDKPVVTASDTLPDGTPIHRYSPEVESSEPSAPEEDNQVVEPEEKNDVPEPVSTSELEPVKVTGGSESQPISHSEESGDEPKAEPEKPTESKKPEQSEALPAIVAPGIKMHRETKFVFPWKSAIAAFILVLIAAIVTFLFLPKATLTLTMPATLLGETFAVQAKTAPSEEDLVVAGNLLTAEKTATKTISATGKKDVGTKAKGTITLFNKSGLSITIDAGTTLTASSKTFTLDKATTIPGATVSAGGTVVPGQTSGAITATAAGEGSNLSNVQFAITGQSALVYGSGSTTGGTTKQVTILSQDDVTKAYDELKAQLTTEAAAELSTKAEGQTLLEGSTKEAVKEQKVDKTVGSETETATATVVVEAYVIALDLSSIEDQAKSVLSKKLEPNQQLIIQSEQAPKATFKEYSSDKTAMTIEVIAAGYAAPDVNKAEISQMVKNRSVKSAEDLIKEKYQAEEVKVEIFPGWWMKRLPFLHQAISVEYGFHEISGT